VACLLGRLVKFAKRVEQRARIEPKGETKKLRENATCDKRIQKR